MNDGCEIAEAEDREVCSSREARLANQIRVGRFWTTQYSIQRWLPSLQMGAVVTHSGRCLGQFFT